jgi:heme exporter protein D
MQQRHITHWLLGCVWLTDVMTLLLLLLLMLCSGLFQHSQLLRTQPEDQELR